MKAVIINYALERSRASERVIIHRTLYGHTDFSNNGSYQYEREGILDTIPKIKLGKGVLVVSDKDKNRVLRVLKKNKASVKSIPIDINKAMLH